MGHLDKDRKGNIIIRRNAKGEMVDKKGRKVNQKGYLVDNDGNVVNKDGKVMFESFTLSKDGEIPKLFPFLKFNIDEVKGDYEMDPLGNPMLQKTREGYLVDSKGRRVNAKGYLIDPNGNVVNKKGIVVFNKRLLEDDGEIPKVFRAGLLRKDTFDSFS
jgi:glutathione peroxidase-family protein